MLIGDDSDEDGIDSDFEGGEVSDEGSRAERIEDSDTERGVDSEMEVARDLELEGVVEDSLEGVMVSGLDGVGFDDEFWGNVESEGGDEGELISDSGTGDIGHPDNDSRDGSEGENSANDSSSEDDDIPARKLERNRSAPKRLDCDELGTPTLRR